MSNNRMLALVAIVAGALFTGACADDVTGPGDLAVERPVVEGEPMQLGPEAPAIKAHGEWPDEPEEE